MIVACEEKGGTRIRRVVPLSKDPLTLKWTAQRMARVPNFLDGQGWEYLQRPDVVTLAIDDVGVASLDRLEFGVRARAHITFWDKRLRGRELLCKRIAEMWVERYQLQTLYTSVPIESRVVALFSERVGFKPVALENGYIHMVYLHGANSTQGGI